MRGLSGRCKSRGRRGWSCRMGISSPAILTPRVALHQARDESGGGDHGVSGIRAAARSASSRKCSGRREQDVDLKKVIVQHTCRIIEEVLAQRGHWVESFDPEVERQNRMDLSGEIVCTIDPDDAKDYDDAISPAQLDGGLWELGVHIADVSFFVKEGLPLMWIEAGEQHGFSRVCDSDAAGGVVERACSLQEGVPRLLRCCLSRWMRTLGRCDAV